MMEEQVQAHHSEENDTTRRYRAKTYWSKERHRHYRARDERPLIIASRIIIYSVIIASESIRTSLDGHETIDKQRQIGRRVRYERSCAERRPICSSMLPRVPKEVGRMRLSSIG